MASERGKTMADIERKAKGRQKAFFKDEATDKILSSLLVLLSEHWTLKQRVLTLEKLLQSKGCFTPDELEEHEVDEQAKMEFEGMRQKLLADVFASLEQEYGESEIKDES